MSEVTLLTNQDTYERLHRLADGRAATVTVDRAMLLNILIDHSIMVRTLRGRNVKVTEPVALRKRTKQD